MALVPCVTNANPSLSLLGGGGGGGGGGATVTISTLTVSTIQSANTEIQVFDPLNFAPGANLTLQPGGAGGDIIFSGSQGALTGVSSINGAPYGAASVAPSISTNMTSGGWFGAAPTNMNLASMAVSANAWYSAQMGVLDFSFQPQPNATDCFNISIADQTNYSYLATFNCAQISTNKGVNNSRGFSVCGPYEAISTVANFVYTPSSNISCSTFITCVNKGWLTPLA